MGHLWLCHVFNTVGYKTTTIQMLFVKFDETKQEIYIIIVSTFIRNTKDHGNRLIINEDMSGSANLDFFGLNTKNTKIGL